ncbi:uncharacterized protein LOC120359791 [Solenopsis invicta]|uniref:uncharacterized protein LOC120359791 n=1 Tax=Solenopsis invicta TaxID=13686 RepID=UPI00193CA292|nr:uncharacterized protein LOC120359791 [Solenopsis invicta]
MARLSNIVLIIAVNVLICVLAKEELYSEQYDHLDVRGLLANNTQRESYYNCFMGITPCTSEQKNLKMSWIRAPPH